MTDKIMDARRKAFEDWHYLQAAKHIENKEYEALVSWLRAKEYLWVGWNAALDSLCVELPEHLDAYDGWQALEDCREAIHAAGVRTK